MTAPLLRYGMELRLDEHQGFHKKSDLVMKNGRIKSKRASRSALNQVLKRLDGLPFTGEFGAVKIEGRCSHFKK